jgi:hypothetical protein
MSGSTLEAGVMMMKLSDLIAISTFRSRADAQTAKGLLDEAGIESIIQPDPRYADPDRDSRDGRYPHSDYAQVMVRAEDVGKAGEVLHGRHRRSK